MLNAPEFYEAVVASLHRLERIFEKMAFDLTALTTAVQNETTVESSTITLLGGISTELQNLINANQNTVDPAAIQAIVNNINSSSTALAAAVAAVPPVPSTGSAPAPTGSSAPAGTATSNVKPAGS